MDVNYDEILFKAECLIGVTYGSTQIPELGYVTVTFQKREFNVFFRRSRIDPRGWNIIKVEEKH